MPSLCLGNLEYIIRLVTSNKWAQTVRVIYQKNFLSRVKKRYWMIWNWIIKTRLITATTERMIDKSEDVNYFHSIHERIITVGRNVRNPATNE